MSKRRTAHWASIASNIRTRENVSWDEAKGIYRRLTKWAKKSKGRPAARIDLRREKIRVKQFRRAYEVINNIRPPETFIDFLEVAGVLSDQFRTENSILESLQVSKRDLKRLANAMAKINNAIQQRGYLTESEKKAAGRVLVQVADKYGIDISTLFSIARKSGWQS